MKPDWKDAPKWANYVAKDTNGAWWWYESKPMQDMYLSWWWTLGKSQYYHGPFLEKHLGKAQMKPDWKDAPEWANYVAMDEDGGWWWHENRPTRDGYLSWYSNGKREYCDLEVPSWKDSLEEKSNET